MTSVWIAQLDTRHFDFLAVDKTEDLAREAMKQTWIKHRNSIPEVERHLVHTWEQIKGDVSCSEFEIGGGYRDYHKVVEPIIPRGPDTMECDLCGQWFDPHNQDHEVIAGKWICCASEYEVAELAEKLDLSEAFVRTECGLGPA